MTHVQGFPIRLMLVDDHTIVRAGLSMLLDRQPDLTVVGEATDRESALLVAEREQPDVILLDLDFGTETSLSFFGDLRAVSPNSRILLLTGVRDPEAHVQAIRLGAMGVVLKEQSTSILINAIKSVYAGEAWLGAALTSRLVANLNLAHAPKVDNLEKAKIATLTERERQVIRLICEGLQNKVLAQRLNISETTVRHHLTSIFSKLGVENRLELVIYAYRHALITLPPQT